MNAIIINAKRVHEFEREQEQGGEVEMCRVIWREKRKG